MIGRITRIVDLLNAAKAVSSKLVGEQSTSLRLDCLTDLGTQTTTIHVSNAFAKWAKGLGKNELKFPLESVYNVRVIEIKPLMKEISTAVHRTEDSFVIDFKECLRSEMCRLEIQYRMERDYLGSFVHSRSSPEPLGDVTRYTLSAQLTDPQSLVSGFTEVDVNEYPVISRVYVKEDVDVAIPGLDTFRELRKLEDDMFSNYNPREGFKIAGMQHKRFQLKRQLRQENPREVLRALNKLLLPAHFRGYLRMEQQDFRYQIATWGLGRMEMPDNVYLPEEMNVITRTDLGLSKPAAHGVMHYDKGKFEQDVKKALGDYAPKKDLRRIRKA